MTYDAKADLYALAYGPYDQPLPQRYQDGPGLPSSTLRFLAQEIYNLKYRSLEVSDAPHHD